MTKKIGKLFGVTLCVLISLASHKAYAQTSKFYNISRLSGPSRYDTSANISEAFASKEIKNVIIANGNSFPDSLAGSVLSKKLNAPILLVSNDNSYSDWSAESYIFEHLSTDGTIYVLGGEGVISTNYLSRFRQQGYTNFVRLGGSDRFATNSAIVDKMNVQAGTPVVLVNGLNFPDALSISSIAASKGYPILMSNSSSVPNLILQKLNSIKPSKVYMIGGTGVLSANIKNSIKSALSYITDQNIVRISGNDRYETSINVSNYFNLDSLSVVISSGLNFPDALSGSALAAKLNAPILLTDGKNIDKQKGYIDSSKYNNILVLGGEGAVSSSVRDKFNGTKLEVGKSFPQNSTNEIVDFKSGDVNGDGNNENIILTNDSNDNGKIFIQDPKNGQVIGSKNLNDYSTPYGKIILADINGDKVDDIMSLIESGGSSDNQTCDIASFKNSTFTQIAKNDSFEINENLLKFSLNGWDTLNINSAVFGKSYSIDLTKDQAMQQAKSSKQQVYPYLGHGPRYSVTDINGDGVYEVRMFVDISGAYHADVLSTFNICYKYSNSSWTPVKFDINSEFPIKQK